MTADPTPTPEQSQWRVIRHGGRSNNDWRDLFAGDEQQARFRFILARETMRQGGVRLIRPDGEIAEAVWAPTLRTRW